MKAGIGIFMLISLMSTAAFAADIKLGWTGHVNATHYRIYMSVDGGNNWTMAGADVSQPSPFPEDERITTTINDVPEDVLVLFRASAMRGDEERMLSHQGAWYDHRLSPPSTSGLAVD